MFEIANLSPVALVQSNANDIPFAKQMLEMIDQHGFVKTIIIVVMVLFFLVVWRLYGDFRRQMQSEIDRLAADNREYREWFKTQVHEKDGNVS